jgi:Transcriptional regulatory protein, C terminal
VALSIRAAKVGRGQTASVPPAPSAVPFGLAELQARIRAVLRRVRPGGDVVRLGPLVVDIRTHRVTVSGSEVSLTPKEFDILECLASDPGRVVTRQEILETAWDAHWYGPTKVLDVHMASLRRKLGIPGVIETVYGRADSRAELRSAPAATAAGAPGHGRGTAGAAGSPARWVLLAASLVVGVGVAAVTMQMSAKWGISF